MQKWWFIAIIVIGLNACVHLNADKEWRMNQKIDSLEQLKIQLETEINNYFYEIENIERNFSQINELEKYISIQSTGENLNNDIVENINKKISLISVILKKNAEKINLLTKQLKQNSTKISGLNQILQFLQEKNDEQKNYIEQIKQELTKQGELILKRDITIKGLSNSIKVLESENLQKSQLIEQQSETIHTGYYAFGTYRELKRQQILSRNGLFASPKVLSKDFDKNYFLKIDTREITEIPLYSHKVKIHTAHPKNSYLLVKQDNMFVLKILNPAGFWEVSNYLVVEVD